MRLLVTQINHEAQRRQDGYAEAVLSRARRDGNSLVVDAAVVEQARREFPLLRRESTAATIPPAPVKPPIIPKPTADWPLWARRIAKYRSPEDVGVGDTVRRLLANIGGERYKEFMKSLGIPCKCASRQVEWNEKFPYTAFVPGANY